ncbi:hypothetical protein P7C70_g7697, partial [Phenoliferia sp. Uapishka_3]
MKVELVKQKFGELKAWGWDMVGAGSWEDDVQIEPEEGEDRATSSDSEVIAVSPTASDSTSIENDFVEEKTKDSKDAVTETKLKQSGATIPITVLPRPRKPPVNDDGVNYIGFLPHSGYHNQRVALQNALLLGKLLNRTVLVAPVWIGWPVTTQPYDRLQQSWTDNVLFSPQSFNFSPVAVESPLNYLGPYPGILPAQPQNIERLAFRASQRLQGHQRLLNSHPNNLTAADCKSYKKECRHTYSDTFLSWEFLTDLSKVDGTVKLVDRWDIRERVLEGLLNVEPEDFYVMRDHDKLEYFFSYNGASTSPLVQPLPPGSRYRSLIPLPALAEIPHKVLLFGSLFGSGRMGRPHGEQPSDSEERVLFQSALVFRNPWIIDPADAIRKRLGGTNGYIGVHARIGEGGFLNRAKMNMEEVWNAVVGKLKVKRLVREEMWKKVGWEPESESVRMVKREDAGLPEENSAWRHLDDSDGWSLDVDEEDDETANFILQKRSPAPATIPPPSSSLRNLKCRAPLHTEPNLLPFNTPLYIATDSRTPTTDPNLVPFFASFPCTFVLSDFTNPSDLNSGETVDSVGDMLKLVNKLDGVPLGRLFLPFMEAVVAAKGFETVGTKGSTFSGFAQGAMHRAYMSDPDEEAA